VELTFILLVKNAGKVLIIKDNVIESIFLISSNLLSDNQLLEINKTVFHLKVLSLHALKLFLEVLNIPSHVRILQDDLAEQLLLSIVIVDEILHHVIADFLGGERWQIGVDDEILKVAESSFNPVWVTVKILLVIYDLHILFVVSLKEWINAMDQLGI
jgi:hypothetical protein